MSADDKKHLGTQLSKGPWFIGARDYLDPYSGARIPSDDPLTRYAADLVCGLGFFLTVPFVSLKRSGVRGRKADRWNAATYPVAVGLSIWYLTDTFGDHRLVVGAVGRHLAAELESRCPGASDFVTAALHTDIAQVSAKSARLLDEQAQRLGVKLSMNRAQLMMGIPQTIGPAQVAVAHAASVMCGVREGELYKPLSAGIVSPTETARQRPLPPPALQVQGEEPWAPPSTSQLPFPSGAYEDWRRYCIALAAVRRIPERQVSDLIPSPADADWTVPDSQYSRVGLEQSWPGREEWLRLEGVTETDISGYWAKPNWVRRYIQSMIERNWDLQVAAVYRSTGSDEDAVLSALLFIPRFSFLPDEELTPHSPLPFELFDRVNNYWTSLSDQVICDIAVEESLISATAILRNRVSQRKL